MNLWNVTQLGNASAVCLQHPLLQLAPLFHVDILILGFRCKAVGGFSLLQIYSSRQLVHQSLNSVPRSFSTPIQYLQSLTSMDAGHDTPLCCGKKEYWMYSKQVMAPNVGQAWRPCSRIPSPLNHSTKNWVRNPVNPNSLDRPFSWHKVAPVLSLALQPVPLRDSKHVKITNMALRS